jgi:endo-1,4-beta-xylanase
MRSAFGNFATGLVVACGLLSACGGQTSGDDAPGAGTAGAVGAGNAGAGGSSDENGGTAGKSGSGGALAGGTAGASWACAGTPTTLKEAAACSGRLIGVALSQRHLSDTDYVTAAREFNYVTAENEMKWSLTQPERGRFTYERGDEIVDFAVQNQMKVKGHTLVWYNQLPGWVDAITSVDELRSVMVDHITQVMTHYKGKLIAWDVVNEAWVDWGTELRDNVFLRVLGPGYIDEAFQAARAADPDAILYYNDYGTEGLSAKANSVYEMVRSMKERGIPIDGVGMQMHTRNGNAYPSVAEFSENIRRIAALGLEVVISEIDVVTCGAEPLADRLAGQRTRYHDLVWACLEHPACKAVTVWGVSDRYSWLNYAGDEVTGCSGGEAPRGLLWDDAQLKKPAYSGVLDALSGR